MFTQKYLISALLAGFCAIPASATVATYSSLSAFQSATSADTFSSIAFAQGSLGTSTTDLGVVFSTNGAGLSGLANPTGWPSGTAEPALVSNAGINTLTVTLPAGIGAVDFYVGPQNFSNFTITVTDSLGGNFSSGAFRQNGSVQNPVFFGASTDGALTSITILSQASVDQTTIDEMQIGQAQEAEAPEAATLLLVGTGLFLMGYARRRWIFKPAVC